MNKQAKTVNKSKIVFISLLAALVITVAALVGAILALNFRSKPKAVAASGGRITVHVFDPANEYNKLGGWFWVAGMNAHDVNIGKQPLADEQFKQGSNAAYPFVVNINDEEVEALRTSKDFGMLINIVKNPSIVDATIGNKFDAKFTKETSDIFTTLKSAFDENNHADIYYVRKDTVSFTDIEEAKKALEKVTSARFDSVNGKSVTVSFETTKVLTANTTVQIFEGESESPLCSVSSITLNTSRLGGTAKLTLPKNFDFGADYRVKVGSIQKTATIAKTVLIDTAGFIDQFECADTQDAELGAIWTKQKTTFRVWAPFASAVGLRLYDDGDRAVTEKFEEKAMQKRNPSSWGGIWELTVDGNLAGKYYTYAVTNYGQVTETIDPYAKAAGVNGDRGMVVDLDSTDPQDWDKDAHIWTKNQANADNPIVYELQVKDFSSSPDSGMKYKGKYLAFTEQNTTLPGDDSYKTGINYLKDLGITYVHLNPVYDFSSVDESTLYKTKNREDFNWGYDPENYNVPEGSYSTNPYDGNVRINEFKQMVMALHNAGIGVIMDVVYNHTFATAGQAFHNTVPYYYHRTNADGSFANGTGCGNETASERTMMRKYMIESVKYWAEEYHIDGFRFDLMGIHDRTTMKLIRSELDTKVKDGKTVVGSHILMYGEPWGGYDYQGAHSYDTRTAVTAAPGKYASNVGNKLCAKVYYDGELASYGDRIATFDDQGRGALRGGNDLPNDTGWIGSNSGSRWGVQQMIEGQVGDNAPRKLLNATQNVAYSCAHDNYPLWDQLVNKNATTTKLTVYDNPDPTMIKKNQTVSSAVLMSSGISFMLAGEEMGRTKYGNHDSYNSTSKVNAIDWSRQKQFKSLVDHYKAVIKVRKAYPEYFTYSTAAKNKEMCYSYNVDYSGGAFMGIRKCGDYVETSNSGGNLRYVFNPSNSTINNVNTTGYTVYVANGKVNPGNVTTVQAHSVLIMGKKSVTL